MCIRDRAHQVFEMNFRDYVLAAAGYICCHACGEKVGNGWIFCLNCVAPVTITGLQEMISKDRSWAVRWCNVQELVETCVIYVESGAFSENTRRTAKGIQKKYQVLKFGVPTDAGPVNVSEKVEKHLREAQTQETSERTKEIERIRPQTEDWKSQNLAIDHNRWRKRFSAESDLAAGKDPDHLTDEEIAALPLCEMYGDTRYTAELVSNRALMQRYHRIWSTGRVRHYDAFLECAHYRESCQEQGIGKYFCMRLRLEKAQLNGLSTEPLESGLVENKQNYLTKSQSIIDRMLIVSAGDTVFDEFMQLRAQENRDRKALRAQGWSYNPIRVLPTTKLAVVPAARFLAARETLLKTEMSDDDDDCVVVGEPSASSNDAPVPNVARTYYPMKKVPRRQGPRSSSPSARSSEDQRVPPWRRDPPQPGLGCRNA